MNNAFLKSFTTLQQVYNERAFSSIALNKTLHFCKAQDKALITKIVYGVLDNDIKLDYVISKYVKKMPKGDTLIFLKMGTYCLMELSIPFYAVVNDIAELAKVTEDKRLVGFVNATLKSIAKTIKSFDNYPTDELEKVSVKYSSPLWALKKLVKDYGKDTAIQIVSTVAENRTTARFANGLDAEQIQKLYNLQVEPTPFADAFYIDGKLPTLDSNFTVQSLSSMAIAHICANGANGNFLDCCSAPGGKAVYVKQLRADIAVTACDVHEHRVQLINAYASRMGVQIQTHTQDMTQYHEPFDSAFDTVLCDVPCSGFGVLNNRPDIKLFRESLDISNLMKLQQQILQNCSKYVKVGGRLVYSTCTIFQHENWQNINKFLKNNPNFTLGTIVLPQFPSVDGNSTYQFLPHKDGTQGFYVAVLTRKE
ncbi:MAG: 16S rRNA (cytosine(967)-C(5))-methyltransferase RsmB [Clostridia bacterium]|nr:16S rRNA (cytosine(967)-C(5))-methyltransferase RsmB [Clostridia bacterium]